MVAIELNLHNLMHVQVQGSSVTLVFRQGESLIQQLKSMRTWSQMVRDVLESAGWVVRLGWLGGERGVEVCWLGGERGVGVGWLGGERCVGLGWLGGERGVGLGWLGGERGVPLGWLGGERGVGALSQSCAFLSFLSNRFLRDLSFLNDNDIVNNAFIIARFLPANPNTAKLHTGRCHQSMQ